MFARARSWCVGCEDVDVVVDDGGDSGDGDDDAPRECRPQHCPSSRRPRRRRRAETIVAVSECRPWPVDSTTRGLDVASGQGAGGRDGKVRMSCSGANDDGLGGDGDVGERRGHGEDEDEMRPGHTTSMHTSRSPPRQCRVCGREDTVIWRYYN